MSIRVGIGRAGFDGDGLTDGRFWPMVDTLEALGYDSLWLSDTAALGGIAPLTALAAVAARTTNLKLGTSVLVLPGRNPVLLARELATVDVLSGGRMLPAGGLGIDLPSELAAMGVAREERGGRLEESIGIIKALWPGEPVTRAGRFWSLQDVRLTPKPTRPRLALWLAGPAPAALRRVGRLADGWLASQVGPGDYARMTQTIRQAAADAGRTIDDDHYGMTVFAAPAAAQLPPGALELLQRKPGLAREDHIAFGAAELRTLLERFVAAGASKFVVIPSARDLPGFLHELHAEVV